MKATLFLLLLALPAQADWTKIPSKSFDLPPPPAEGSAAYEQDFAILHRLQDTRTEEQCELSRRQEFYDFDTFFGTGWDGLTRDEQDLARPLTSRAMKLADRVSEYFKDKFHRPRPYNTDPTLHPCVKPPTGSKAYPSGHSVNAAAGACVLGLLFPEKAQMIAEYGDSLGELRAIVGVHHPSDVAAGLKLGRAVCARLKADPEFRAELPAGR